MNAPVPVSAGQRGFSLVTAIFLLVILAALGAFMLTISTSQHMSSALDIQGTRAYRAARAGIEWGAATICNGGPACATPLTTCFGSPTIMTIDGVTVSVSCTMNAYPEAGTTTIAVSTASWAATAGGTATFTTALNHGLTTGQLVTIMDVLPAGYNRTDRTATVTGGTTFTIPITEGDPGAYASGGTVTPPRYIFWLESTASTGGAVGSLTYVERTVNSLVGF